MDYTTKLGGYLNCSLYLQVPFWQEHIRYQCQVAPLRLSEDTFPISHWDYNFQCCQHMSKQRIWDRRVDSCSNCVSIFRFLSVFCQLHIPSGNASVQLATLTKLTHIFLNFLMRPKLQRPTMDAWAPFPRPPSTVCNFFIDFNVMLSISSIFSVIVV